MLGLLSFGPRSGYDLLKLVESSIGFFWSPAKSRVYAELKRLSSLGLVSEERVIQEDRPSKRVYSLTPEGQAVLSRWLRSIDTDPDEIRSQLLLKLFFGRLADPASVIALVRKRREEAQQAAARLRQIEAQIRESEDWLHPYLTLRYGLHRAEAIVRWADEALAVLEAEGR